MNSNIFLLPASCSGIPATAPSPIDLCTQTLMLFPSSVKERARTWTSSNKAPLRHTSISGFSPGLRSFRGRMIFKVSLIEIQNEDDIPEPPPQPSPSPSPSPPPQPQSSSVLPPPSSSLLSHSPPRSPRLSPPPQQQPQFPPVLSSSSLPHSSPRSPPRRSPPRSPPLSPPPRSPPRSPLRSPPRSPPPRSPPPFSSPPLSQSSPTLFSPPPPPPLSSLHVPQEGEFAIRDKLIIMKGRITKKISKIKMAEKKLFKENEGFKTLAGWATLIKLVLEDLPMEDDPFIVQPHLNDINRGVGDLLGIDQQLNRQFGADVLFRFLRGGLPGLEFVQDAGTLYVPINRNPLIGESLRQLTNLRMELKSLRLEQETMENQLASLGAT